MNNLIEALQIFSKYGNPKYPTCCGHSCGHNILYINPEICPDKLSFDDRVRVEKLGFFVTEEIGERTFASFGFGSF
jgi:hypothetical protein